MTGEREQRERASEVTDQARIVEELEREAAVAAARAAARRPGLEPNGACHWCEASLAPGRLYCDDDCHSDWQRAEAAKARHGR